MCDLLTAGVAVAAVIDPRTNPPLDAAVRARRAGLQVLTGAVVTDTGGVSVRKVDVRNSSGHHINISADILAMAGGWNPAVGLGCNLGARPEWSEGIASFILRRPPAGMVVVGAADGHFALKSCLRDGFRAGTALARELGYHGIDQRVPETSDDATRISCLWHIPGTRKKAFVDFQNDVTDRDVELAAREGFVSVEHLKRYTTLGMATDQGKMSQVNGHALLAHYTGKTIAETGTVLSRPPFAPIAIAALAGHHRDEHFRPIRITASHTWAAKQGAHFVDAASWKRAQWFTQPGEVDWLTSVSREVMATRSGVGVCDVSTLGKIEIHGPDAAVLLDRLYINTISTLAVSKVRYGVMLREDGFVMDDGTVTRLAAEHFFITTTTVNAVKVMQHIDFCRQVLWPELNVQAVSVTEQWAQFAVAGPKSRDLLQRLLPEVDLSNEAFPYMAAAMLCWRNVPARLYRVSFSGELAYEIGVPARYADALMRTLMEVGAPFGVVPYGTEALGVMRIEKGHAAGNELNGQTTATDLGLGRMMSTKKDYIGRVMAGRPGLTDQNRLTLVGIRPVDHKARIGGGAHLLPLKSPNTSTHDQGHITSVAYSPSLGCWIGLALLKQGPKHIGERLRAYDPLRGRDSLVEICNPVFIDPEGLRLRA